VSNAGQIFPTCRNILPVTGQELPAGTNPTPLKPQKSGTGNLGTAIAALRVGQEVPYINAIVRRTHHG
ncbi:MAG: hypothetical protein ABJP98_19620, partial [Marinobacter alexandrii]|uniref:hypothetical protein n=1 Tax=Marinobacter alexandrii TaxID=2570351 RepID=UPI0032989F42